MDNRPTYTPWKHTHNEITDYTTIDDNVSTYDPNTTLFDREYTLTEAL